MRATSLALIPILAALATAPASAQIRATVHVGPIHIGGGADRYDDRYYRGYPPRVVVVNYPSRNYGQWKKTARYWRPVTVYYYGGHYYQRPFRNARPVVIYRYRDHYFSAPRDRDWNNYRGRYERDDWRRYRNDRGDGWRDDDRWDGRRDGRRDNRADRRDDRRDDRQNTRRVERRDAPGNGAANAPGRGNGRGGRSRGS